MVKIGYSTPRCSAAAVALFACAAAAGLAAPLPAQAGKVGVAAAVNPDAFSSLSGVPNKQLNIGKSIFYNERIETTTNGLVQVLLVDGSTFTVGPNSNLVIDKFVYDPNKKTGEMVATFSKGSMRFIGGKLSKNAGGVQVNTPSGALAIRGGMFQGNTQKKIYSFLYGHSLTFRGRNGQTQTIFQPGYTLDLSRGGANVRPTTAEDTAIFAKALTSRGGSNSASGGDNGGSQQGDQQQASGNDGSGALTQTVSLQSLISDATSTQITDEIEKQLEQQTNDTPASNTPPPSNTPTNTAPPTTGPKPANNTPPDTPAPTIDARVIHTGPDGLLTNDLVWTFTIKGNRLLADIPGDTDIDTELATVYLRSGPASQFDFPATLNCLNGFCSVENAKVTTDGETTKFIGHAVLKNDFFAYHVADGEAGDLDRLLVFGGKKHNFGEPAGKVYVFALTNDIVQGDAPPFASGGSSAIGDGNAFLIAKEQNGGAEDQSRPVWLQTSFALGTGDSEGQSFVNIALGEWSSESGLSGSRRGGADLDSDNYSFSGDIASIEGPDGGHFLGADGETPNAVLTLGGSGTENPGRDTPLHGNEVLLQIDGSDLPSIVQDGPGNGPTTASDPYSGSTYHIASGTETLEGVEAASGTFKGYAAGFSQQANSSNLLSLVNSSPNDFGLTLDGERNNVSASMNFENVSLLTAEGDIGVKTTRTYSFGGPDNSALIDDNVFAAFETPEASTVHQTGRELTGYKKFWGVSTPQYEKFSHTTALEANSYIVSADAMGANEVLFPKSSPEDVQKRAFCQDCDFIKWGAWGTRSSYTDYRGNRVTEDTHLGWWIAGDVVSPADMPGAGDASYAGDVIGTVAKLNNGQWNQSVATGKLDVYWNFHNRLGTIDITKFDNKNLSGVIGASRTSPQNFVGGLAGNGGIVGTTAGSFVGSPGKGQTPRGVIGNFNASQLDGRWKANGIYGGTQIPR